MDSKIFSSIFSWLKSTEMFARPSKQLPGKWQLYEYYIEKGEDLLNFKQDKLIADNQIWNIEFTSDKTYFHECNLPVWQIGKIKNGNWSISKNFITLISTENEQNNIEFQFSVENENLRLLKKDTLGRIEFFGFLSKVS